jgi:hypothetical protein
MSLKSIGLVKAPRSAIHVYFVDPRASGDSEPATGVDLIALTLKS